VFFVLYKVCAIDELFMRGDGFPLVNNVFIFLLNFFQWIDGEY
jgi:hypothetical protein